MSSSLEQRAPARLWVPGTPLDEEYPVPSLEELAAAWEDYNPETSAKTLEGVYGVYTPPAGAVRGVASVDLCEVVRQSATAMDQASGVTLGPRTIYDPGTWYDSAHRGKDYMINTVTSTLQVVMAEGLVEPVEFGSAIAAFLRNWRRQGIYCVANTSTLPGCELGTIKHTLGRDLPGCFDALLLPRNYDGNGPVTKAGALALLGSEASLRLSEVPMVHIDDSTHHITAFTDHYGPAAELKMFVPRHRDNTNAPVEMHCETPLEAFVRADSYFAEKGVTHAR